MAAVKDRAPLRFGIDVGGTKIALGLVSEEGELVTGRAFPTPRSVRAQEVLALISGQLRELLGEAGAGLDQVEAVGMGFPGEFDGETGRVLTAPNVPSFVGLDLCRELQETLRRTPGYDGPVRVGNDARVAALAEARWGAGTGCRRFLYLTVSTGVGGAVFESGPSVDEGGPGDAVNIEPGLKTFPDPDRPQECLERLAGGAALARRAREALRSEIDRGGLQAAVARTSLLQPPNPSPEAVRARIEALSARDLAAEAERGDRFSQTLLELSAELVASSLLQLIRRADDRGAPLERIVVGGSIALKAPGYLEGLRTSLTGLLRSAKAGGRGAGAELVASTLGDDRGVLGATLLVDTAGF